MVVPKSSPVYRDLVHVEELSDKKYACDLVAMVLKKWSGIDYCDIHVTDFTSCKNLLPRQINDGPDGQMTLKIEAHAPHKGFAELELQMGQIVHFRNLKIKWNRNRSELEGTLWPDKFYPGRVNIETLPKNDPNLRAVNARKQEYFDLKLGPKSASEREGSKRKRRRGLQREAQREECARIAKVRDQAGGESRAQNHMGMDNETADKHMKTSIKTTDILNESAGNLIHQHKLVSQGPEEYNPYEACKSHIAKAETNARQFLNGDVDQDRLRELCSVAQKLHSELLRAMAAEPVPAHTQRQHERYKLLPLAFPNNQRLTEKLSTIFYHGSIAIKRNQPWLLTEEERSMIKYPVGLGPQSSSHTTQCGKYFSNGTLSVKQMAFMDSCAVREEQQACWKVRVCVIDYYPESLADFIDIERGAFQFWLKCAGGARSDGSEAHLTIAIRNEAAEELLGMTFSEVVDGGERGIECMRRKLNLMWGDLELLKRSYAYLHPEQAQSRFWASCVGGLWPNAPQMDIGVCLGEARQEWNLCHTRLEG